MTLSLSTPVQVDDAVYIECEGRYGYVIDTDPLAEYAIVQTRDDELHDLPWATLEVL